ncbi:uncharacterized protein P884DRAFT_277060 [Thermothelomyces heterothallicus CBS 202.75]|uniref:uncharacterized protein n=1 Tax=Thermothelomyces heterothallicus CBS 202.75 TaxID=1149848 RepID=UPI003743A64F
MATHTNPFLASLGNGKLPTLAEIEAAAFGRIGPEAFQTQQVKRPNSFTKVSRWLADQDGRVGDDHFANLNRPRRSKSSRNNPIIISDSDEQLTTQRQQPSQASHAYTAGARATKPVLYTPPSSIHLSSRGRKRIAPDLDDKVEEVIVVQPPRSIQERRPRPTPLIDLRVSRHSDRTTSFLGNWDEDVLVVASPAERRRELRQLALGNQTRSDGRPQKRPRHAPVTAVPAANQTPQPHARAAPDEPSAPEADAAETTELVQSIASVTHFFSLATEIRDKIYRHLLVSPKPIHVRHLWTEPARRSTRRGRQGEDIQASTIDTKILAVCRRTALEGTRVLYSENTFFYLLRDPEVVMCSNGGRRSQRIAGRSQREQNGPSINLARYGHLIRHMAIELEPNRTEKSYEKLMSAALETLAPATAESLPSPPRPVCSPIHLHILTITISPLLQSSHRTARSSGPDNQDVVSHEGRFLSTVSFFNRGSPVLKALQRLNTDFLRINVHVNSDIKNGRSVGAETGDESSSSDDDMDDDNLDGSSSAAGARRQSRRLHLETTIDLRCLPRRLEALRQEPGPLGQLWASDVLMQEQRRRKGEEAGNTLAGLRRHLEDACLKPDLALRGI